MKIVTYNVFLSTPTIIKCNSQAERSQLLGRQLLRLGQEEGVDVFCVQELIQDDWFHNLYNQLKHAYPYSSRKLQSSSWLRPISGGVYTFSKHPIVRQAQRVFENGDCTGIECLVSKGVVWTLLDTPEGAVDVLNTHLQAWDSELARRIRKSQVTEIRNFVRSLDLPVHRPLVVCGDFNFDFYSSPKEIRWIEEFLSCSLLVPPEPVFSSDPLTNQLVGNDSSGEYVSSYYPDGCYPEYQATLSCPCCPRELLDLVFVGAKTRYARTAVKVLTDFRSPTTFVAKLNFTTERFLTDLSDHYPVMAQVTFTRKVGVGHQVEQDQRGWIRRPWVLVTVLSSVLLLVLLLVLTLTRH
jgi:endonuclease/exonuclease/phosphatase family metal-dependent hydrolase